MKILHKYVLREHLGPLLFAASALTSLMLLNYIAKQLGNLVGKGLGWEVIAEFFVLSLPFTVAMTLPMAVLVSVLYAFSRLAAENEITAMKANGVSMRRIMVPVLVWGVTFSIGMIVFNDRLLPLTNHRLRTLQGDIARKKPSFAIREQIINEVSPGQFFLRTTHLDPATNKMRDVTIYDLSDALRRHTIYADSGVMAFVDNGSDLKLTLYDGFIQEVPKEEPTKMQRLYYQVDEIRVTGVANAFERDSSDNYKSDREMSVCELQGEVARFELDFFRARERYDRAAKVARNRPNGTVEVSVTPVSAAVGASSRRARVGSLGRTYCDGVNILDTVAVPWIRKRVGGLARALLPSAVLAQQSPDTLQARRDSLRRADSLRTARLRDSLAARGRDSLAARGRDSLAARGRDSLAARMRDSLGLRVSGSLSGPDSAARRDSLGAAPALAPGVTGGPPAGVPAVLPPGASVMAAGDTLYPGAAAVPPALPVADPLPLAPSAGMTSTIPVAVEMESARSEMLRWRAQINQYAVEIHKKFAISAACTVFVLLGAPLALRFPRGGVGLVIGVSLVVFALYYVGLIAGESLADRDILPPALSMWAANIIFALAGLVLIARMERDGGSARGSDPSELWAALRRAGRWVTFRRGGD